MFVASQIRDCADIVTFGSYDPSGRFKWLNLPGDLTGKRILDIGARDGYFTLQCERAGADVIAVDNVPEHETRFSVVRDPHNLKSAYIHGDLFNLTPGVVGGFDIVLHLEVIYHVTDPIGSLDVVRELTEPGGRAYVESTCIDEEVVMAGGDAQAASALAHMPVMVYARRNASSFWDLNSACLPCLSDRRRPADGPARPLGPPNAR